MDNHVFISFSSKDRIYADTVLNYLENNFGIKCWICYRDIIAGSVYSEEINNAIKSCACLVLLYSKSSKESDHVKNELEIAEGYKKTTILCKVDDSDLECLFEYHSKKKHWIDIIDGQKEKLNNLALSVCKIVGDETLVQINMVHSLIVSFNNGATPELIQKFIDEGYKLTQLYQKRPKNFKEKYEALSRFSKSYRDFCNEIQRIVNECNGDIANNHAFVLKLLNDMLDEIGECKDIWSLKFLN
jgi:TIR domain.